MKTPGRDILRLSHLGPRAARVLRFRLSRPMAASLVMIVSHGLISAALFLVLGFIEDALRHARSRCVRRTGRAARRAYR